MSHTHLTGENRALRFNQYADFGAGEPDAYSQAPERTSIMAILSLVLGIVCVPGFGVIAVLLAIGAFFGISGSRGRVGGMGLAIAGLILGLLATALWAGLAFGGLQFWNVYQNAANKVGTVFEAIDAGDYQTAATELGGNAGSLTTNQFDAFKTAYQTEYGTFVGVPEGIGASMSAFGQAAERLQGSWNTSGGNSIPIALEFDSGWVIGIYEFDPRGGGSGAAIPPPIDLKVVLPNGAELSLFAQPAGGAPVGGGEAAGEASDGASGETSGDAAPEGDAPPEGEGGEVP